MLLSHVSRVTVLNFFFVQLQSEYRKTLYVTRTNKCFWHSVCCQTRPTDNWQFPRCAPKTFTFTKCTDLTTAKSIFNTLQITISDRFTHHALKTRTEIHQKKKRKQNPRSNLVVRERRPRRLSLHYSSAPPRAPVACWWARPRIGGSPPAWAAPATARPPGAAPRPLSPSAPVGAATAPPWSRTPPGGTWGSRSGRPGLRTPRRPTENRRRYKRWGAASQTIRRSRPSAIVLCSGLVPPPPKFNVIRW